MKFDTTKGPDLPVDDDDFFGFSGPVAVTADSTEELDSMLTGTHGEYLLGKATAARTPVCTTVMVKAQEVFEDEVIDNIGRFGFHVEPPNLQVPDPAVDNLFAKRAASHPCAKLRCGEGTVRTERAGKVVTEYGAEGQVLRAYVED